MYFEKTHRTTEENDAAQWQITAKPKELHLVHAKRFSAFYPDKKTLVVKYDSIINVDKFIYENGLLTLQTL